MRLKIGRRKTIFLFLLLVVLTFFSVLDGSSSLGAAKAAGKTNKPNKKKVVLVVINGIGLDDLSASTAPNLYRLANQTGAIGLLNTRTAGIMSPVNNYLTIGTGVKSGGGLFGGLAFNSDENYGSERAGDVYESRTGIKAPPTGVVNLGIADISRQSQQYKLNIYPGSLGRSLKESGFKVGVLGNADSQEENGEKQSLHREIALIGMDHLGRVPFGNVSRDVSKDEPKSVGGLATDYKVLSFETNKLLKKVDFLAIETGDAARVEEFSNFLLDREIPAQKAAAIKKADKFIGTLIKQLNLRQSLLIVASPIGSRTMQLRGNNLTPVIVAGPNIKPGVLTSPTTRNHGIVDSTDIAPTVISFLGGQVPFYMTGRPLSGQTQSNPIDYLSSQLRQVLLKFDIRVPVLTTYVTTIAIILLLSLIVLLLGDKGVPFLRLFQMLLLWTISVPLAMLIGSAFNYSSYVVPVLVILAVSVGLVALSTLFKKNYLYPILIISLLTSTAVILDTLTGAHLMQRSLLGYCPIIGARFYGMGNEYMGVLIGASIIGITLLFDVFNLRSRMSYVGVGLLFVFVAGVIGYQAFGANVGGAIAAVVAFVVTFVGIWQGKVSLKHLLIVMAAVFLAVVVLALLDLMQKGGNSHLGRNIVLVQKGGFGEVVKLIQRKIAMNIKGTRYTSWTRILIAALVVFPTLFLRPVGAFAKISKEYPLLTAGHIGIAFGAIAAFLFNDTGAAAAATIIVFSVVTTLFVIMHEQVEARKLRLASN